jgi:hypothetical protein
VTRTPSGALALLVRPLPFGPAENA